MLHLLHASCLYSMLIIWAHALSTTSKEKGRSCTMSQWESAGCTTAGNYVGLSNLSSADDCCAACAANATNYGCYGWTFHQPGTISKKNVSMCYLSTHPRRKAGVKGATCGCRNQDCTGAASTCRPIYRPPLAQRTTLPPGIKRQPNIVSVIIDDMVCESCCACFRHCAGF